MEMNPRSGRAWRFLVGAAAFVVVIAGIKAADSIVIPFLVALYITTLCVPSMLWLMRKGLSQMTSMILVIVGIMLFGLGMAALVGNSLNRFTVALPAYQQRLQQLTASAGAWLDQQGVHVTSKAVLDVLDPGAAVTMVGALASGLGALLANTFLILLTVVFMLVEGADLPLKMRAALGEVGSDRLVGFTRFAGTLQSYLVIKTWISLASATSTALWLWILGVDFPLLWGLLAFVLNYVPNIGSIISAIPPIVLALLQYDLKRALLVAAGFVVVNVVFDSILEPRFTGRGVGLSPLIVFLSLIFWGWVLGPVGMLLSIPLTMAVKILLETSSSTHWVAILLGPPMDWMELPPAQEISPAEPAKPQEGSEVGAK
jgi:predicted PurR-regulated permease PerM